VVDLEPDLALRVALRRPTVVVVGDAVLDGWLVGHTERLCREGPAPVVDVTSRRFTPGAAANIATSLAALGARTRLVTQIGDDADGWRLADDLHTAGVDLDGLVVRGGRPTTSKVRVAASGQLLVRFDEARARPPGPDLVRALIRNLDRAVEGCDAVVVGDYDLGLLTDRVRDHLAEIRHRLPLLVVDAHDCARWARTAPDLMTPSVEEAGRLLRVHFPSAGAPRLDAVGRAAGRLVRRSGARRVAVTCDRDGVLLLEPDGSGGAREQHRTWARATADSHTTGAGDTFTAATTLARCAGLPWPLAVELGQAAADVVVGEPGPSRCDTQSLTAYLGARSAQLVDAAGLEAAVTAHRTAGRRIVFTNGCFDVLHRAHVASLEEARRLGDVLVVAVNSDASVRRLKGPGRPVNPAEDRAAVLASLRSVDHVTVFDADTPIELLLRLRPDVYVKGGDYSPEMLAEAPVVESYGGRVRMVRYVPGHSTTAVIERIVAAQRRLARAEDQAARVDLDPVEEPLP
jgi:D-beta-D-heptose 7-phosphate kinase/D-beta-D-heptose 1-phosphate adenosyltransferase